jgi:CRP/FNR family transcriptional regulator, cyclic AMP receptor protein
MPLREQIRLLSMVDVFEPLSEEELEALSRRAPDTHVQEGEVFLRPWDRAERLYVLKRGRVELYEVNGRGEELTLSLVEGGNIFGEMALTGQQLSDNIYARALEPSVVCFLGRKDLEQLILSNPEVGLRLVRRLSERLREAELRLAEITRKDVRARLASLILRLVSKEGVRTAEGIRLATRYTHQGLGAMIGAKRVAVSRALSRLRAAGAVEVKQRHIYLRDQETLERIASEEK